MFSSAERSRRIRFRAPKGRQARSACLFPKFFLCIYRIERKKLPGMLLPMAIAALFVVLWIRDKKKK